MEGQGGEGNRRRVEKQAREDELGEVDDAVASVAALRTRAAIRASHGVLSRAAWGVEASVAGGLGWAAVVEVVEVAGGSAACRTLMSNLSTPMLQSRGAEKME